MKDYTVFLDIVTSLSIPGSRFAELFGIEVSALIYREIPEGYLWRYEIEDDSGTLLDRINHITSQIQNETPIKLDEEIKKIYLNVGVFYDTACCTVSFPGRCIEALCKKIPQLEVEISCYPVDNDVE